MIIRESHPQDSSGIDDLLQRSYPTLMAPAYDAQILSAALPTMTRSNATLLKSGTYYVAVEEGRIVSCGGWTLERPGASETIPGIAHLRHFATDPAFARQGIGRQIYRRCTQEAARQGAKVFQVASSLNAEPFYASLGFGRVAQVDVPMGSASSFPTILMEGLIAQS